MSSDSLPVPEGGPRFDALPGAHGAELRVCVVRERLLAVRTPETLAGWRFSALVLDANGPVKPAALDWRDAELVDFAVLDHAAAVLAAGEAPPICLLPASFSTLSSTRGRRDLSERLQAIGDTSGRRPALEAHGLAGVPAARLAEVITQIRPTCAGVIAEVGSDRAGLAAIGHCGLAGFFIRTQTAWMDDSAQLARIQTLTDLARGSAPICIGRSGEDDLPTLAAAGFTHAAVLDYPSPAFRAARDW